MQEEMIKNVSNIEKYQPFSLLHDQFVLSNVCDPLRIYEVYEGIKATFWHINL